MQEEKYQEALDYFNKDLADNPKNGYSYSWIAHLRLVNEEYGKALTAVEQAIKNLPKKDAEYVIFGYSTRAKIYLCLEDTTKALSDYSTAIKVKPDESKLYESRAQIYYELQQYELADADYREMTKLQPGDVMGYMGMGRNANAQKRWSDAIKQFDYVTKLANDYSSGYAFRAEAFIGLEKWNEATDDIISAMKLDWDRKAMYLANLLKEPALTMLISKMKVQSIKSPNDSRWPYAIGSMYEQNGKYAKAVDSYKEANSRNTSPVICERIANCCSELGQYHQALSYIDQAINMDSTDLAFDVRKADILYDMGDVSGAISQWDKILAAQPDDAYGYQRRGWFKELAGDPEGAMEDLSMSIVLDPNDSYAYVVRGRLYLKQGERVLAEADFNKVIELEDTPEKYSVLHYAYQGLGQNKKAMEVMDRMLADSNDLSGTNYDAACLYARMGMKEKALFYLGKSLELGNRNFAHMARDYDMDPIRDTDEYKRLIKQYQQDNQSSETNENENSVRTCNTSTIEIPFTKESGVNKVKCEINGLPLHFVLDTGASDVTLSMVEATFMMKNGYLSGKDVVGNQRYMDANGDVSVGTVINLKDVNFGGQSLTNVRASVVRNQKAPLLLGQSVLGRLGKIEIDNAKNVIKITRTAGY